MTLLVQGGMAIPVCTLSSILEEQLVDEYPCWAKTLSASPTLRHEYVGHGEPSTDTEAPSLPILTINVPPGVTRFRSLTVNLDLEEIVMRLWANPDTCREACSSRLATTTAVLFAHFRQVARLVCLP
jgi:hypothetical protein